MVLKDEDFHYRLGTLVACRESVRLKICLVEALSQHTALHYQRALRRIYLVPLPTSEVFELRW